MEIYTLKDLDLFKDKIKKLEDEVVEIKLNTLEPTKSERVKIINVLTSFIKKNKLKIYDDRTETFGEIFCYTPTPLQHNIQLCNLYYDMKFKDVEGSEDVDQETYKVIVNGMLVCMFTYVPDNIYDHIDCDKIKDLMYVKSSFKYINAFKAFSDPINSSGKWEEYFKLIVDTQNDNKKLFETDDRNRTTENKKLHYHTNKNEPMVDTIYKFIQSTECLIIGKQAFNMYLYKMNNYKLDYINVDMYDIVSFNYQEDVKNLYNLLSKQQKSNVEIEEHYPFWKLIGYSCYIKVNGKALIRIIDYNGRCIPYHNERIDMNNDKLNLKVACYDYQIYMLLVDMLYYQTTKEDDKYEACRYMMSHYIKMRETYLKDYKITMLSHSVEKEDKKGQDGGGKQKDVKDVVCCENHGKYDANVNWFQQFMVSCMGETVDTMRLLRSNIQKKVNAGLKGKDLRWIYRPEKEMIDPEKYEFKFFKVNGAPIENSNNLRIILHE